MTDSSAMIGYFPVLDELLKSLLNKFRDTPFAVLAATVLETVGTTKAEVEAELAAAATRAMLMIFMLADYLFSRGILLIVKEVNKGLDHFFSALVCFSWDRVFRFFSSPEHVIHCEFTVSS